MVKNQDGVQDGVQEGVGDDDDWSQHYVKTGDRAYLSYIHHMHSNHEIFWRADELNEYLAKMQFRETKSAGTH